MSHAPTCDASGCKRRGVVIYLASMHLYCRRHARVIASFRDHDNANVLSA